MATRTSGGFPLNPAMSRRNVLGKYSAFLVLRFPAPSQDGCVTELLSGLQIMVIITFQFALLLFKIGSCSTLKLQIG